MRAWLSILYDSGLQAWHQLMANRLRTFLSLLGVSIGIFCIISVFTAVDSLEGEIKSGFAKLGNDVLYISKMPWTEDPNRNYWKYLRRPDPDVKDYESLKERLTQAQWVAYSYFVGLKTTQYRSNAVNGAYTIAVTPEYAPTLNLSFQGGRFFNDLESNRGSDVVVIGDQVATSLFGALDPVGRVITVSGRKMRVVGVIEPAGNDLINPLDFDWCIFMPYRSGRRFINVRSSRGSRATLMVAAREGITLDALKEEVIKVLRNQRRLRPIEDNNFSLNSISVLATILDDFFSFLDFLGLVIGGFSLIVGAFSVANIMFVSVKERTNQIGIKKALGASSSVILLEFLIESVLLCVAGGLVGLMLVFGLVQVLTHVIEGFEFVLYPKNVLLSLLISTIIGVVAGIIPAFQASQMNPVDAIRK